MDQSISSHENYWKVVPEATSGGMDHPLEKMLSSKRGGYLRWSFIMKAYWSIGYNKITMDCPSFSVRNQSVMGGGKGFVGDYTTQL